MSSYRRNGLPKPYLCSFNVMKYLWEFQCEFFFLLLGHCHLFHCNHTLHLTLTSTLGCICKISQMVEMSLFPKSANFFFLVIPFVFDSNLLQPYYFCFFTTHFCGAILSWLSIFIKRHTDLLLGDKKACDYMPHCLCMNWTTDVQWPITNRPWKK